MKSIIIRILLIILLGALLWAVLNWDREASPNNNAADLIDNNTIVENKAGDDVYTPDAVIVEHLFNDGLHRLEGSIVLPNPCWEMEFDTIIAESFPEQVTLDFTLTPPPAEQACIQVVEEREFTAEFQASPNPILGARVNGKSVPLITQDTAGTLESVTP